jgi:hypothetical protein
MVPEQTGAGEARLVEHGANDGLKHLLPQTCKSLEGSEVRASGLEQVGKDGAAPYGNEPEKQAAEGIEGCKKKCS